MYSSVGEFSVCSLSVQSSDEGSALRRGSCGLTRPCSNFGVAMSLKGPFAHCGWDEDVDMFLIRLDANIDELGNDLDGSGGSSRNNDECLGHKDLVIRTGNRHIFIRLDRDIDDINPPNTLSSIRAP